MRNLPWPSTICASAGGAPFWVTLAIVVPRIVTVLFGTIRPSTTSTTLTRVIASARVCGATETVGDERRGDVTSRQIVDLRSAISLTMPCEKQTAVGAASRHS